jgi:hypothetical protein
VDQIVKKALRMWSMQIPLNFKRVSWGTADIIIGFARRGKNGSFRLILCAVYISVLLSKFKSFHEHSSQLLLVKHMFNLWERV